MGKHTPGPWISSGTRILVANLEAIHTIARAQKEIAYGHSLPKREAEANARLLAAAPDLFAALERLRSVAGGFEEDSLEAALDQALEALAKAEDENG
jgi:hypothetical protein